MSLVAIAAYAQSITSAIGVDPIGDGFTFTSSGTYFDSLAATYDGDTTIQLSM